MASARVWKLGEVGAPAFPSDYEIVRKAVLQVTDIETNRNKYYALELHAAKAGARPLFRVFTHYGRTDDLETRPDAGQKASGAAGDRGACRPRRRPRARPRGRRRARGRGRVPQPVPPRALAVSPWRGDPTR